MMAGNKTNQAEKTMEEPKKSATNVSMGTAMNIFGNKAANKSDRKFHIRISNRLT
jgi:hypothetical protein